MAERLDFNTIKGTTYNYLTIIKEGDVTITSGGNKKRTAICKCKCGIIKKFDISPVINSTVKSCGCYSAKIASERMKTRNRTHGMYNTPENNTWQSMKKRCNNKSHISYKHYGGRKIKVCDEWNSSFENFYRDMGERPSEKHSLDRVDNNKGYSKENCRWATKTQQARNQRSNVLIEYKGEKKCLQEWADLLGFSWQKLHYQIFIAKHDLKKVFQIL